MKRIRTTIFFMMVFALLFPLKMMGADFAPLEGQKYYLVQKGENNYVFGYKIDGTVNRPVIAKAVLGEGSQQFSFEIAQEAVTGDTPTPAYYFLKTSLGYLHYVAGWQMDYLPALVSDETVGTDYFQFSIEAGTAENEGYFFLRPKKKQENSVGGIALASNISSDKPKMEASSLLQFVIPEEYPFERNCTPQESVVNVEAGYKSFPLPVTMENFEKTVKVISTTSDFKVSPASYLLVNGVQTINVSSNAPVGTSGSLIFYTGSEATQDSVVLATIPANAVAKYDRYYLVHSSGLVLGYDPQAILAPGALQQPMLRVKENAESTQSFIIRPVEGGVEGAANILQHNGYKYLNKRSDSNWDTSFGLKDQGDWQLIPNESDGTTYYTIKNLANNKLLASNVGSENEWVYADKSDTELAHWKLEKIEDFVVEEDVYYTFTQKGSGLVLGQSTAKKVVLRPLLETETDNHLFKFVPAEKGNYYIVNKAGQYLYADNYSLSYQASIEPSRIDSTKNKGYRFNVRASVNMGTEICVVDRTWAGIIGSDGTEPDTEFYADKSTNPNAIWTMKKEESVTYDQKVILSSKIAQIEKDGSSFRLAFTTENVTEPVMISLSRPESFALSVDSYTPVPEQYTSLEVSSTAEIGIKDTVIFTVGDQVLAKLPVEVIAVRPRYYIVHNESGLVVGNGDSNTQPQLVNVDLNNKNQQFILVPINESKGIYNLVQDGTNSYLTKLRTAGDKTNFGIIEHGDWELLSTDGIYTIRNLKGSYLAPQKATAGQALLANRGNDLNAKWKIVSTIDMKDDPVILSKSDKIILEENGYDYTLFVRVTNTKGASAEMSVPEGFSISQTTLAETADYAKITVSTTAAAGTTGKLTFSVAGVVYGTFDIEVKSKLPRYVVVHEQSGFTIGSVEASEKPVLREKNAADAYQHLIFVPVNASLGTYYILQEPGFRYFSKRSDSGWDTSFGNIQQGLWTIVRDGDRCTIRNVEAGSLGMDKLEVGASIFANKGNTTWVLEELPSLLVTPGKVLLESATATSTVTVSSKLLSEDITVSASEGFAVDKETITANEETPVVISASGENMSGTITFKSGSNEVTVSVRIKEPSLTVSSESISITGKGGYATFTVTGKDLSDDITIAASEGFVVDKAAITAGESVSQSIKVTYTGTTNANGTITLTSGSFTKEIAVSATFTPELTVSATELLFASLEGQAKSEVVTVTANDLFEEITITSTSDAFEVTPQTIPVDTKTSVITINYLATKDAEGVITVKCGSLEKTITVKGTVLKPDLTVSKSEMTFLQPFGQAHSEDFTITAKDLAESITITSSSDAFEVTPLTLAADTKSATVTVNYLATIDAEGVITIESGNLEKTITVKGQVDRRGLDHANAEGLFVYVKDNGLYINNLEDGSMVSVTNLDGKTIAFTADFTQGYELPCSGVYLVKVIQDNKTTVFRVNR